MTNAYSDIMIEPNSSKTIAWKTFGVSGSNKASIEVSSVPTVDFGRRLNYLIQYPHGCVEQTTSSVFPQLYLTDVMDLDAVRKQDIQRNVTAFSRSCRDFPVLSENRGTNCSKAFMTLSKWSGKSDSLLGDMLSDIEARRRCR